MSAPFSTNPQEVFITAISLIVYRNLPVPISPQGVRRAPHGRQRVILCTWPFVPRESRLGELAITLTELALRERG